MLAFLKAARRGLNWRVSRTDRTLMAILLVHLHAKKGEGLSNQLRQSKAMSPAYSVRWWKAHKMRPPKIDVPVFFAKKFQWRYAKGVPSNTGRARAKLGDARYVLPQIEEFGADLVLTSPPYSGVTNYQYDNWIRLWMLGGPPLPSRGTAHRFRDPENYETLLEDVFRETRRLSKDNATIYVRTDAREFTLQTTLDVLTKLWPAHRMSIRFDTAASRTQTSLFQDK